MAKNLGIKYSGRVDRSPDLVVERDGSIRVTNDHAKDELKASKGAFHAVVASPELLVFRRAQERTASAVRVLAAGELVSRTHVLEIVNQAAAANWYGQLHIVSSDAHRVLVIDGGALKSTKSDDPEDRLGDLLFRTGVLTRNQLEALVAETGGKRLGQRMVERGFMTQEALFSHLQKQAQHVFNACLLVSDGVYAFLAHPEDADATPPPHTVHLSLQGLLMEGVQRIDEMELFRQRIPRDSLCPQAVPRVSMSGLEPSAVALVSQCDGQHSIEDLARAAGLDHFTTVKNVYQLIQQGLVVLNEPTCVERAVVEPLVSSFNDVLADIFMAVAAYGGLEETRAVLDAWVQGSGYGPMLGGEVGEDGRLDVRGIVRLAEQMGDSWSIQQLHQMLHELVAFALFTATSSLPRDQELALSRDVTTRLKRIKI